MIRRLYEADRERVMELAGRNPSINLFIIGDVENFGFEQEFMELWGECESPDGPLKAVLLRFTAVTCLMRTAHLMQRVWRS